MRFVLQLASLFFAFSAGAAVSTPGHLLIGKGSQIGGVAGAGFTLMDLRLSQDKKKHIDRIVVDVADMEGRNIRGLPGYFHAELKSNPQKLIVDFSQMPKTRIDEKKLAVILKRSRAVQATKMTIDPIDHTLSISLDLKKNTKVRIQQVAGLKQTSKVVFDLISE